MDGLTAAEQSALLRFVHELHELRDVDGFVAFVVRTLPRLVRSDQASYTETDTEPHKEQVLAPIDRQFQLTAILEPSGTRVVRIGLYRDGRDYDARERKLLELVRPHLALARRNALAVSQRRRKVARRSHSELIAIDALHRIRFASILAVALLGGYVGAPVNDELPTELARWVDRSSAPGGAPPPTAAFVRDGPAGRLTIHIVEGGGERFLLLDEVRRSAAEALRAAGLTTRERDVVGLLVHGKTNAEIGAALGISERTVDKHLEHVLRTLGLENRTAVAAFALEATVG